MLCQRETWRKVTDFLPSCGINTLIIDIGEGVRLDSHPEIAIEGAWSKDELRAELARLRSIGLSPIPKFNFSCGHSTWMGDYAFMVGTKAYYECYCKNLIAFDKKIGHITNEKTFMMCPTFLFVLFDDLQSTIA